MGLGFFDRAFISARTKLGMTVDSILESGKSAMEDGGSFKDLSSTVDELGGGAYHITRKAGVYLLLIAIAVGFIILAFSKAHNREEAKSAMMWKIIGGAGFFAAVSIIVLLETLGQGLFKE